MATTITTFFEQAKKRQFARDFLFRVKQVTIAGQSFNGETDLVYARSANFPARGIQGKTAKYFGQDFQVPGASTYPGSDAYSIEFYHDESVELRKKFEKASRAVFNNTTSKGAYQMPGAESYITLSVLDRNLAEVSSIKLVGASIREISAITHNIAEGSGDILNFTVTFAYHFYDEL